MHHYLHKTEKPHAADWGYTGRTGPEHWGDLCPQYVLAKTGRQQSPVDITGTVSRRLPKLKFDYKSSRTYVIYSGHTVEEMQEPGGYAGLDGKRFLLQQFHFHSPSEHTVDGNHFPMEMHLVHQAEDGTLGVVAVFIQEGQHNEAFEPIWSVMPDINHPAREGKVAVDAMKLLPNDHTYYAYDGSFTTPPCTEHVKWAVLTTPVSLSKQQIERFRAVIKGNNRPVQPLNGRQVTRSLPQ